MNNINDLWDTLGKDKEHLDSCIKSSAKSPIDLSNQVTQYIINSGGKRIRPLVLLLLARAMNYEGELHYQLATAVEFIHTATLLHDDVVDESDMRRNRPTVNNYFGNAAAVLVGDFLYSRAFQLISQELEAAKIISDATNELAMGEVMQLMNINNLDLTEKDYFQVIHLKTAVLFSAACQFSAVIANKPSFCSSCADYGRHLGIAFQIADDVLDYVGEINKIGKNIGNDLVEKKMTLPLIHAMGNACRTDKLRLHEIIRQGERQAINEVIDILKKTESISYAQKQAYRHADLAKSSIQCLDDSLYKTALNMLPDLAVNRNS